MRIVGKGKLPTISTEPSGENLTRFFELVEGTRGLGFAGVMGMKPGVYRFKTHAEADEHRLAATASVMARAERSFKNGK